MPAVSVSTSVAFAAPTSPSPQSRARRIQRALALTGNRAQAELLAHIEYWLPRARYRDANGMQWLIRTADEFRADGVTWTAYTIRKALRGLAAGGFIELRHGPHPYGGQCQLNCSWITLPAPDLAVIDGGTNADQGATFQPKPTGFEHCSEQPSNVAQSNIPLIQQSNSTDVSGTVGSAEGGPCGPAADDGGSFQAAAEGDPSLLVGGENCAPHPHLKLVSQDGIMPTADELLKAYKAKATNPTDPSKPLKPMNLYYAVRTAWVEAYPGEAMEAGSDKVLGQLKHLIAYMREQGLKDIQTVAAVTKAVRDWSGYTKFVAARTGFVFKGTRPSVSNLLYKRDELLNFYRNKPATNEAATAPSAGPNWGDWGK